MQTVMLYQESAKSAFRKRSTASVAEGSEWRIKINTVLSDFQKIFDVIPHSKDIKP